MTYRLFLDDERFPPNDGMDWVIVRDYASATEFVMKNGGPLFCSFDHDLGSGPSGYDFVKWLVEHDQNSIEDGKGDVLTNEFNFYVHSQNPVGKENIVRHMKNYLKFKRG